jgi:hypothetical protein
VQNVFAKLLAVYLNDESSEDLKTKSKRALKSVIAKCVMLDSLEPMLGDAPRNILKYIVHQFAKVLPNNADARRAFVSSGGLKKVQEIQAEPGSKLKEYVDMINVCYPEEIVRYYSPNYAQSLLDKLDS